MTDIVDTGWPSSRCFRRMATLAAGVKCRCSDTLVTNL